MAAPLQIADFTMNCLDSNKFDLFDDDFKTKILFFTDLMVRHRLDIALVMNAISNDETMNDFYAYCHYIDFVHAPYEIFSQRNFYHPLFVRFSEHFITGDIDEYCYYLKKGIPYQQGGRFLQNYRDKKWYLFSCDTKLIDYNTDWVIKDEAESSIEQSEDDNVSYRTEAIANVLDMMRELGFEERINPNLMDDVDDQVNHDVIHVVPQSAQAWVEEGTEEIDVGDRRKEKIYNILSSDERQLLSKVLNHIGNPQALYNPDFDFNFMDEDEISVLLKIASRVLQASESMLMLCQADPEHFADRPNGGKIVPQSGGDWTSDWTPKMGLNKDTLNIATRALDVLDGIRTDLKESSISESTLPTKFMDSLDNLSKVASQAANLDVAEELRNAIRVLREEIVTGVSSIDYSKHARNISIMVIFVSSTIAYLVSPTRTNKVLMIMSGIGAFLFTNILTENTMANNILALFEVVNKEKKVSPQLSDEIIDGGVTGIIGIFSSYLVAVSGKSVPSELMDHLRNFGRSKHSLKEIINVVVKTIESIYNYVRTNICELEPVRFISTNVHEVDNYLETTEKILSKNRKGDLFKNASNSNEIAALISIGNKIIRNMPRAQQTQGVMTVMNGALNALKKIQAEFAAANVYQGGYRQEPVGVLLHGGPGVGKSIVLEHLARACCAATLEDSHYEQFKTNPEGYIYVSNSQAEFWEGFHSTSHVFMIDDFGQFMEALGKEGDASRAIKGGNGFPYPLPRAGLDDKGNTYFNCKFMVATTNLSTFNFQTIISNQALDRRWACRYIMAPKDSICANPEADLMHRKFNYEKLPAYYLEKFDVKVTSLDPTVQMFHEVDAQFKPTGKILTWEGLVNETIVEYFKRRLWFEAASEQFKKTEEQFRPLFRDLASPQGEFDDEEDLFMEPLDAVVFDAVSELKNVKSEHVSITAEHLVQRFEPAVVTIYKYCTQYLLRKGTELVSEKHAQIVTLGPMIYDYHHNECFKPAVSLLTCCMIRDFGKEFIQFYCYDEVFSPNFAALELNPLPLDLPFSDVVIDRTGWEKFKTYVEGVYVHCKEANFLKSCSNFLKNKPLLGIFIIAASSGVVAYLADYFLGEVPDINGANFTSITSIKIAKEDSDTPSIAASFAATDQPAVIEDIAAESYEHVKKNNDKRSNWLNSTRSVKEKFAVKAEGNFDSSGEDLITSFVKSNQFLISYERDDGSFKEIGSIFFVKGRIALMPYHFYRGIVIRCEDDIRRIDKAIKIHRGRGQKTFAFMTTCSHIIMNTSNAGLENRDLCLVEFPRNMQPCQDRIKNFCLEKDLDRNSRNIPFLMYLSKSNEKYSGLAHASDAELQVDSKDTGSYRIRNCYIYPGRTTDGDCGSLFCVLNPSIPVRKIFGMHVAGHTEANAAYSSPITQEMLLNAIDCFSTQFVEEENPPYVVAPEGDFGDKHPQFNVIGGIKETPMIPEHSVIRKSDLHDTYAKSQMAPTHLKKFLLDGEMFDPVDNALQKYCGNIVPLSEDMCKQARDSLWEYLCHNSNEAKTKKILTTREAILGIDGEDYFKGLTSSTSSGFPMNTSLEDDLFRMMFDARNDKKMDEFERLLLLVIKRVEDLEQKYKDRIRPLVPCSIFPKDERLLLEKVAIGKLRIFLADFKGKVVLFKKYFGAFSAWIMENRVTNGCCVGVNFYSHDWHMLATQLLGFDPVTELQSSIDSGDFSKFDGSLQSQLMWMVLDIVNWFYDDEFSQLREDLWIEVVNSRHVFNGILLEFPNGQPSGGFMTIMLNTLYVHLAFRCCWILAGLKIYLFNEMVVLRACGDDSIYSVHPTYRSVFNAFVMPNLMAKIGLEYTTETKGKALVPFRKITEVEFNKRSFVYASDAGMWIGPLRLSTILEIPMWTKKGADGLNIVADNTINALKELSLHDKKIYAHWSRAIIMAFKKYYPKLKTKEPLERQWFIRRALVLERQELL